MWSLQEPVFRADETLPHDPAISEAEAEVAWVESSQAVMVAVAAAGALVGTYDLKPNSLALGAHVANAGHRRVASFSGGMSEENRERLKARFNADPDQAPLRIPIATNAAREGVNLQYHCKHLIHFDIPWNPSQLEQRNGRIDRKLQQAPQVWCHSYLDDDRPEDRVIAEKICVTPERSWLATALLSPPNSLNPPM